MRPLGKEKKTQKSSLVSKEKVKKVQSVLKGTNIEDRNLLKLTNLDSSWPFLLSDNRIWGQ